MESADAGVVELDLAAALARELAARVVDAAPVDAVGQMRRYGEPPEARADARDGDRLGVDLLVEHRQDGLERAEHAVVERVAVRAEDDVRGERPLRRAGDLGVEREQNFAQPSVE